jgi:hypothetical protein
LNPSVSAIASTIFELTVDATMASLSEWCHNRRRKEYTSEIRVNGEGAWLTQWFTRHFVMLKYISSEDDPELVSGEDYPGAVWPVGKIEHLPWSQRGEQTTFSPQQKTGLHRGLAQGRTWRPWHPQCGWRDPFLAL